MQRRERFSGSGRIAGVMLAAVAAVALAGCSAGQITQTDTQLAAVNGEQGAVGQLQISNATLAYPEGETRYWAKGSDVPLSMSIANNGPADDRLELVSSPLSEEITISGDKVLTARRALTVGGAPAESFGEADAESNSGEVGNAKIVLTGIKQDLFPGQVVRITLNFRDAGSVQLRVPIAVPTEPRADQPENEHQGGGHG